MSITKFEDLVIEDDESELVEAIDDAIQTKATKLAEGIMNKDELTDILTDMYDGSSWNHDFGN